MKSVIDGDGILYRAAYATQKTWWEVSLDGIISKFNGDNGKREAFAFFATCPEDTPEPQQVTVAEEEDRAILVVDSMMKSLYKCLRADGHKIGPLYLGARNSSTNFRYTYNPEYKANRPPRPINYDVVRKHLLERWEAEIVEPEFETDDFVAMDTHRQSGLIVSQDKDFKQCEADIYNWVTGEYHLLKDRDPQYELCLQLLTGDKVDNIETGLKQLSTEEVYGIFEARNPKKGKPRVWSKLARDYNVGTGLIKSAIKALDSGTLHHNGYGDYGLTAAKKDLAISRRADINRLAANVLYRYARIYGTTWRVELERVGQQIYLLRHYDDNFNFWMKEYYG